MRPRPLILRYLIAHSHFPKEHVSLKCLFSLDDVAAISYPAQINVEPSRSIGEHGKKLPMILAGVVL